jgi:hypothetical protein
LALETGLGTAAETLINARKNTCEIDDKNQLKKQFISSQTFHRTSGGRIQEFTVGERFKPRILESFDLVTQEYNREEFLQQSTHTSKNRNHRARKKNKALVRHRLPVLDQ